MRSLRKMIAGPHHDTPNHVLALAFGFLFGIIGSLGKAATETIFFQALYSVIIGVFLGLFIALSNTNDTGDGAKEIISLWFFYALRIVLISFLIILSASLFR